MRNTEYGSSDRIWVEKTVDEFYFSHNDKNQRCTPTKIAEFLTKANETAKKDGYVDVVVDPYSNSDEWGNQGTCYLKVRGWREETDKEYKSRLSQMISKEERDKASWEAKRRYYEMKPNDDKAAPHDIDINKKKSAMKAIGK